MRIPYCGGRTNIAAALRMTNDRVFNTRGDRRDVQNYALLFTDGAANEEESQTGPEAIRLRNRRTQVVAGAVGQQLDIMELRSIVSHPPERTIFTVDSFRRLSELPVNFVRATCNGMYHAVCDLIIVANHCTSRFMI